MWARQIRPRDLFQDRRNGTFVDLGAYDGVTYNNTLFFEKELGWTGLCVEPIPERFAECKQNRTCNTVQGCASNFTGMSAFIKVTGYSEMLSGLLHTYDPRHLNRVKEEIRQFGGSFTTIPVQCYSFNDLMELHGISRVNFLSIDTEGHELETLTAIDFSRYTIDVITVEDNYDDSRITKLLESKGFVLEKKLAVDLVFVRKEFKEKKGPLL